MASTPATRASSHTRSQPPSRPHSHMVVSRQALTPSQTLAEYLHRLLRTSPNAVVLADGPVDLEQVQDPSEPSDTALGACAHSTCQCTCSCVLWRRCTHGCDSCAKQERCLHWRHAHLHQPDCVQPTLQPPDPLPSPCTVHAPHQGLLVLRDVKRFGWCLLFIFDSAAGPAGQPDRHCPRASILGQHDCTARGIPARQSDW